MATTLADVLAKAKKKASEQKSAFKRTVKPPQGTSVWRILPGWRKGDEAVFYQDYGQHWIKNPEGEVKVVLVCPEKTFGKDCEVCAAIRKATKDTDDDEAREEIIRAHASQRFLVNAIQIEPSGNPEPQILELTKGLFMDHLVPQMEESVDEDTGKNMLDPSEGSDIKIVRDGTGLNTSYTLTVRPKSKSKPVAKSALMNMNDIDEFVRDDFDAKKEKAIEVLGDFVKDFGGSSSPALTGPRKGIETEIDDEIPDYSTKDDDGSDDEVEDAEVVEEKAKGKADDGEFGSDLSDDELDKLLDDI